MAQWRRLSRPTTKPASKYPILGEGEHKYECIHDWGELPSNIKYGNTHSVCEDAQGHIYIHHTVYKDSPSPDSVVVFDEKGKFVRSWGPMFRGGAHGMHLRKEGKTEYLYFCDEKHGIITKRTLKGEEVWTMGYPQDSPIYQKGPGSTGPGGAAGLNYRPTNIAIAPNGDFWVGDGYGSYYMFHYSVASPTAYPKLVNMFGGPAPTPAPAGRRWRWQRSPLQAPRLLMPAAALPAAACRRYLAGARDRPPAPIDQMNNPHGNMVDLRDPAKPILLVADRGHGRIVRYTLDDKPIDIIEGTRQPCHFHEYKGNSRGARSGGPGSHSGQGQQSRGQHGRGETGRAEESAPHHGGPEQVHPRPVRESARRDLRSQRQHLRCGVGRNRARHQAAEGRVNLNASGAGS